MDHSKHDQVVLFDSIENQIWEMGDDGSPNISVNDRMSLRGRPDQIEHALNRFGDLTPSPERRASYQSMATSNSSRASGRKTTGRLIFAREQVHVP